MKKSKLFLVAIITMILITATSCSKSDESTNSSLTPTEQKLIGKWNTSSNLKGNTYSYNSDKTAAYINTYNGVATTYNGAWTIIDGDVLIEYYPDKGEAWNNNWQQSPTLKNKIEFINDKTVRQTDFYNSSQINIHYKEN
ncbi:hypothetical protein [Flavobacterium urumqiense]|uniref:Lipocalin-like domain-containing protein n=1 Tax=Flavobacterium urumqiense TaxID=935224 RepID=A0A1H5US85_9FLAO|nr:hypothetical protein [Flavobacterium urumqiense]SEF77278.1 hypothetical protein SAMN04488130_102370 [Flavobacterium urumqiense]